MSKRSERSLTAKQQRFVHEYLIDLNATQAAIRAEYKQPHSQGPRLLDNVGVARAIAAGQAKHAEKCEITLDRLTDMTLKAYKLATEPGEGERTDSKAAVSAVAQLSKMHGFDVAKRLNDRDPIDDLTAEERDAVLELVEQGLQRARAKASEDA